MLITRRLTARPDDQYGLLREIRTLRLALRLTTADACEGDGQLIESTGSQGCQTSTSIIGSMDYGSLFAWGGGVWPKPQSRCIQPGYNNSHSLMLGGIVLCAGSDWPCPMAETGIREEGHGDEEEEEASPRCAVSDDNNPSRCAVSDDKNPRLPSRPPQPMDYAYSETDGYEGLLLHAISPG